jgi:hypothetical protein
LHLFESKTVNIIASILSIVSLSVFACTAHAQSPSGPIRIGEINSYKAQAAFLEPYRKGIELALEEVNASGGVLGRKLQVIYRDDNASPGDAVRAAEGGRASGYLFVSRRFGCVGLGSPAQSLFSSI